MSDFNIRADAVDVEQIMRQIRARIRDKRGVDYTEEQIRELATAKLERFLDPSGVRSDLLEQFRRRPAPPAAPLYQFEDTTLFDSDKAAVRFIRRLLKPLLKLFFNYNVLSQTLHTQASFNRYALSLHDNDPLYFELMHNLVVEMTRASIEVKNLKMRLESVQSRLEFNERRARALEAVVQFRPDAIPGGGRGDRRTENRRDQRTDAPPRQQPQRTEMPTSERPAMLSPEAGPPEEPAVETLGGVDPITDGESLRTRRRRRRRGRRGQGFAPGEMAVPPITADASTRSIDTAGPLGPASNGPESSRPESSSGVADQDRRLHPREPADTAALPAPGSAEADAARPGAAADTPPALEASSPHDAGHGELAGEARPIDKGGRETGPDTASADGDPRQQ